jgi:hypothetical protein
MKLFEKCEYEATKGIHLAPKFEGVLSCVQMRIFSSVMVECASKVEGLTCFLPIHLLSSTTKTNVQRIISDGLSIILKRAESRRWNGRKIITLKTQNTIDPFLSALYNTYSLSADLTYPYEERTLPQSLKFTIDITYIAEGEEDSCKLEVLIHAEMDIVLFCWKEFKRDKSDLFLRYKKTTWTLPVTNGNLFDIEYHILENKMTTSAGEMERIVGWPRQRMSVNQMIEEVNLKTDGKLKQLSKFTYKWIKKVSEQYLNSMNVDLDKANEDRVSLLHVLAEINDSKFMKFIIEKIRNIDPCDSLGQTPLHRACSTSSFRTAKLLLEYGADVNALTENGNTPMMMLAGQNKHSKQFFKLLLDFNAKRDLENKDNMRAVDIARMTNLPDNLIKLLQPI